MSKIPVGRVIGQTFEFSFRRYFTLLGIVWLPMLLIGAIGYFVVLPFAQEFFEFLRYAMAHPEYHSLPLSMTNGMMPRMWLFDAAIMLLFVMIGVGITKEALGQRTGPRFVYLGFGGAEMRTAASYFLVLLVMYAAVLAVVVAGAVLAIVLALLAGGAFRSTDAATLGGPIAALVTVLVFGLELGAIYIAVRLSYLIVPVAVMEKRIGVMRSWQLTKGNFWRIVGIWLVTLLPLFFVQAVFLIAVFAPSLKLLLAASQHGQSGVADAMRTLMQSYLQYLPWTWSIAFLLAPALYGLWIAPAAFAYRSLVPLPQPVAE